MTTINIFKSCITILAITIIPNAFSADDGGIKRFPSLDSTFKSDQFLKRPPTKNPFREQFFGLIDSLPKKDEQLPSLAFMSESDSGQNSRTVEAPFLGRSVQPQTCGDLLEPKSPSVEIKGEDKE